MTGSRHLVEVGERKILLDCGTFQGHRQEALRLNSTLVPELLKVDAVVITHAHLDHCGTLPLLIKKGYQGKIYCTNTTKDILELMLLDSANVQAHDYDYFRRHRLKLIEPAGPLYTKEDIPAVMARIVIVPYQHQQDTWFNLTPGARLKFYEAGHILGSAAAVLEFDGSSGIERLVFTGDLGRLHTPLIKDPVFINEEVPILLLESTYGDRLHHPLKEAVERLKLVIHRAVAARGKIIVPAFALGRTQELIYILHQLTDRGEIPRIPIYIDSPLAISLTEVFQKHHDDYDLESWHDFSQPGESPLAFRNLIYTKSVEESKELNRKVGPFIVIAGSGMCEAGRIRHHLANSIDNARNLIMITGFMAAYTLGRKLVDGEKKVKIFDHLYPVKAAVEVFNEFSAHADAMDLQIYASHVRGLKNIFLVHGETTQAQGLKERLMDTNSKWQVDIAQFNQTVNC